MSDYPWGPAMHDPKNVSLLELFIVVVILAVAYGFILPRYGIPHTHYR